MSAVLVKVTPGMPSITFGGFDLNSDGVRVHGRPTFGDFGRAMAFAHYAEQKSPFWKAALLNYADTRTDWAERVDAIADRWGLTPGTLEQYKSVDRRVPVEDRVDGLSFSHHEAVASLPSADKRHYLQKAKRDHLSVSALKLVIKRERKVRRVLSGQAGDLAKAQDKVTLLAHDAAEACRAISADDCKQAEKAIKAAHRALDICEDAVTALRKAQGTP